MVPNFTFPFRLRQPRDGLIVGKNQEVPLNAEFVAHILNNGLTPEAYQEVLEQRADLDPAGLEGLEAERARIRPAQPAPGRTHPADLAARPRNWPP